MNSTRVIGLIAGLSLSAVSLYSQDQFRPLYLSGQVTLEDGSPPPEPVRIELICNARIEPQALTKADGSFSFRVGGDQSQQILSGSADRSQPGAPIGTTGPNQPPAQARGGAGGVYTNPSFVNMSQCEVRAVLAGYRSSSVKLGRRSVFEVPDIGSIFLIPLAEGEEAPRDPLVSVTTLKADSKALKAFEKGQKELFKEKPNAKKAARELEEAIEAYPEFSAAWNLLAEARIQNEDMAGARLALQKAIETDPGFATPGVTLAALELEQGNFAAAIAASERALKIVPNLAEPLYYQGTAYAKMGDLENASLSLEKVTQGPEAANFPRSQYMLGVIYAQLGNLEKAVEHCRLYLEIEPDSDAAAAVRKQLDDWKARGLIE